MENTEINQKIHERLFGKCWHEFKIRKFTGYECKCGAIKNNSYRNPDYAGNISDAFRVVEELEKRGFVWTFSNNGNEYAAKYDVRFFLEDKKAGAPDVRAIAIKETLPLAICEAALKVLGGEDE